MTERDKITLHRASPTIREREVIFFGPAVIGMADELHILDSALASAAEVTAHLIARAAIELVDIKIKIDGLDRARGRFAPRRGVVRRRGLEGAAAVLLTALAIAAIAIARAIIGDGLAATVGASFARGAMAIEAALLALTVNAILAGVAVFVFLASRVFRAATDERERAEDKEDEADANGHDGDYFPRAGLSLSGSPEVCFIQTAQPSYRGGVWVSTPRVSDLFYILRALTRFRSLEILPSDERRKP